MRHAALILVLMLGLFLKASLVMGAEETAVDSTESNDVAYYRPAPRPVYQAPQQYQPQPQYQQPAASAAAAASASAQVDINNPEYGDVQYTDVQSNPNQTIQNNNNITVGNPANAAYQNSLNQGYVPPTPVPYAGSVAYAGNADVAAVIGTRERVYDRYSRVSLTPMIGGTWYATDWNDHIGNNYTFGLLLEVPINPNLAFEVQGGYARYNISYGYAAGYPPYNHYFNQYVLGGNLKAYLTRTQFRPYIGGGIEGICYENMSRGPSMPVMYSQCIGAANLFGGAEIVLSDDIALGGRAAWLIPVFNRPYTVSNSYMSAPGFEEAGAINTSFYQLMATLRIAL